jgi:hypothetical protein
VTHSFDLTALVFGNPATLSNVTNIEIVSLSSGSVVSVGALDVFVDNIRAVPEPSMALYGVMLIGLLGRRHRKKNEMPFHGGKGSDLS